jgi:hypothetical protein|tara:strand:- start:805 stop:1002 length:198 start_codon:yes stop_codon:yes gene_type:complete
MSFSGYVPVTCPTPLVVPVSKLELPVLEPAVSSQEWVVGRGLRGKAPSKISSPSPLKERGIKGAR